MIERSLKTSTKVETTENIEVIYNLIFKNALYSLECFKGRGNQKNPNSYCLAENITDDEKQAEAFLSLMAQNKVLPVHINDMVDDYFQN